MRDLFRNFSTVTAEAVGPFRAVIASAMIVLVCAITGPVFGYSDTWQRVMNTTSPTIIF